MTSENIAFGIIAAVMGVAALRVVTTKNVVHAALYLVVVLFLFGIFLTRAPIGRSADLDNDQRWLALLTSLLLLGVLVFVLEDAFGDDKIDLARPQTSAEVGNSIFQTFVIPFEVVSVLLLAALIGAIVIARRD